MSTEESKKKSSSSSSSKRSKTEERNKKSTTVDEIPASEVHTTNNWENADLGNDARKQKFLRLMGAKKRKDDDRIDRQDSQGSNHNEDVSPDKKHCRSKVENETIERELEKQFNEGLQSKIAHTHHEGLGFHSEGDNATGASSSGDWQHQRTTTNFVPAKTEDGSSLDHVHVESTSDETKHKSNSEKQDKKKKSKS